MHPGPWFMSLLTCLEFGCESQWISHWLQLAYILIVWTEPKNSVRFFSQAQVNIHLCTSSWGAQHRTATANAYCFEADYKPVELVFWELCWRMKRKHPVSLLCIEKGQRLDVLCDSMRAKQVTKQVANLAKGRSERPDLPIPFLLHQSLLYLLGKDTIGFAH